MRKERSMRQKEVMRLIIGTMVVASALLAFFHSRWWLLLTLFIGLNLFQSGLTRWCLLEDILRWRGLRE